MPGDTTIRDQWRELRIMTEFAKHYPSAFLLSGVGHAARHPALDRLLPALLVVKAVAILDAGLVEVVEARGMEPDRRRYRSTATGRLRFVRDQGWLPTADRLLAINEQRHEVVHAWEAPYDWSQLDADLGAIEAALQHLTLLPPTLPTYQHHAERSGLAEADGQPGSYERRYTLQIRSDGHIAAEIAWTERLSVAVDDED